LVFNFERHLRASEHTVVNLIRRTIGRVIARPMREGMRFRKPMRVGAQMGDVMFSEQFADSHHAAMLANAIVDTLREPFVVLDADLRVVAASRAFYRTFTVSPMETQGKLLYELGDGEWNTPKLRTLLGRILPEQGAMEDCEVEHDFPDLGRRTMLLNARKVFYEEGARSNIVLGIEDITGQRLLEREKDELLRQKDVLLGEIQHRIGNSLQIIANIIMSKLRTVESEETRRHLSDAHDRVISIAAVQQHLHIPASHGSLELRPYLTKLCAAISNSMLGDNRAIALHVCGDSGTATNRKAESLGLIVTELVINSLKHAFKDSSKDARITVTYDVFGKDWRLVVIDNGIGTPDGVFAQPKSGLGTSIINALAIQLDAHVVTVSGTQGTTVSVTHSTFGSR
jgi:two-component sensor histidine kinase/PAS domain-containing protein